MLPNNLFDFFCMCVCVCVCVCMCMCINYMLLQYSYFILDYLDTIMSTGADKKSLISYLIHVANIPLTKRRVAGENTTCLDIFLDLLYQYMCLVILLPTKYDLKNTIGL